VSASEGRDAPPGRRRKTWFGAIRFQLFLDDGSEPVANGQPSQPACAALSGACVGEAAVVDASSCGRTLRRSSRLIFNGGRPIG
jgi:hypothetical protein